MICTQASKTTADAVQSLHRQQQQMRPESTAWLAALDTAPDMQVCSGYINLTIKVYTVSAWQAVLESVVLEGSQHGFTLGGKAWLTALYAGPQCARSGS